jgi:vancomycin resistance protein YoaR
MTPRRPPRTFTLGKAVGRLFLLVIVVAALVVHATAAFAFADYANTYKKIHFGVSVYGQNLAGLYPDQAKALLAPKVKVAAAKNLVIKDKKQQWPVEPVFGKPQPDVTKGVAAAYAAGRAGGFWRQLHDRAFLYLKPFRTVVPSTMIDGYASITAAKVAAVIDRPAQDATVEIDGATATVRRSKTGWEVKQAVLKQAIRDHWADFETRTLTVPQGVAPVRVHDDDAAAARLQALKMMKYPIDFTINGKPYSISPDKIGALIGFYPEPKKFRENGKTVTELVLNARLARDKLEQYFTPLKNEFETKPINARFEAAEGNVTIVPGVNGLVIDMDAAVVELNKLALGPAPRQATLKMKPVEPDISTAKAESMGIKERVSVHTENFEYTLNRSTNIAKLAEAIDGMLVAPGQVWSINAATGPRTAAMGYTEAPVIVNGQLSPDIGGGICNVSTTIFNTAFFGGYEIVERYPHDFYISHYPPGRDASIYYDGGMDFKFKNDSPYYILIKTDHSDSSVTIAFYSTKTDVDVSYSDTGFTNIVPYGIVYKDDPTVPAGYEKDGDMGYGVDGRDITVFRTVKKGGQVTRDDRFASHYEPKQRIVMKGTGPALPPGTPVPAGLRPLGQTPR